ncbi:NAD(P)H-binding protein [Catenulispora sp. NF23]|uniref:NAD(P)-dependent oxidoreductase n=1 Tax=Catenulispora pinistramenti TaxID=2705254 RepID=UPI001BA43F20|nr:NAD(P)H-binding protein [Catenulispora pinistramenti]MBS2537032.1 NAD(P)H-binding protein [Catenulispora pinistramenti]
MDIVLFGATGMIGSRIAAEAAARGHNVTAVSRSGGQPDGQDARVAPAVGDAGDPARVAELVKNADVVAAALVGPRDGTDPREPLVRLYTDFLSGVRDGGAPRTVIVGGAGTLLVAPGTRLVDLPDFPDAYKPEALAHGAVLDMLRADPALPTWTYISPAPEIGPGTRTGEFRLGVGDDLLPDAGHISAEDYAIAFVDELESGAHPRQRLSVAQSVAQPVAQKA